jgi:hypothetical protein
LAFTVEDLARTALVRILPRSRYRLAAQGDARFASFASNTTRIAYRQPVSLHDRVQRTQSEDHQ